LKRKAVYSPLSARLLKMSPDERKQYLAERREAAKVSPLQAR
jgi:hypothetical protein